ncbi:sorting nexin-29 isoform X1 [Diabrotica virgifera virgifera]|uniref:Sorting nexin-29 n=2 Tax=Diabrotica virgifera virgifera TaxID=50390 RepID=A0ABM5KRK9_DIAVI|nr:sorting nexin-29 isoform X1 [Diabrotica virgifera virgifera]
MLKLMSVSITTLPVQQKSEEAEKLLKQLLECVQDCQKRFGGKTELATEFECCVAGLCVTLEAVLNFGLKHKSPNSQNSSTIKQVSEIVANTLNIGNDTPSFWPFIYRHLTKHEQERYIVLRHIWTDLGRGRAWIRSTLNERSLERYFHTLLSNPLLLREFYEPWSVLRDEEKNSMLPNMAAGLNSILFAISIDKPEFNSGVTLRKEVYRCKAEPIIEAPIPDNRVKEKPKRKRKVARQFISFEDDDSYLSTSIPSSSSSTTSDSTSLGDSGCLKTKPKHCLNQIVEEKFNKSPNKMEGTKEEQKPKMVRKLSIENSGARDKYSTAVPGSLTPVTQEEIGELTPVSVEVNKNFESPDNSDEILELPTDISAVLSAVETKNKEEIDKREEKIEMLTKENDSLKDQVKKYLSAIQMLRNDDDEISDILQDLEIEAQPNYKVEAKMFEKKLVQVAEMHAELMDFNVMLQQNICQKESLLERLRGELEALRGPMPSDEMNSEGNFGSVNIWIPSAFLTGTGSNSHHVYQIFLRAGNDEWNIYRRYAQFHALHTDLKKLDPIVGTFDFPPKKSLRKKDSTLVEDRRKRLQIYLRRVIAHWPELAQCNCRFLLEQHLSFFKDQREDLHHKNANPIRRNTAPNTNNHSGL